MGPGAVKGDNVLFLNDVTRAKVKGYPRYKRHISQCHVHILLTMHHHINAAENLYVHLLAITNDQVFSSEPGNLRL